MQIPMKSLKILRTLTQGQGVTYCLEAIYPGNRIVVDYQGLEELVLLVGSCRMRFDCFNRNFTQLPGLPLYRPLRR